MKLPRLRLGPTASARARRRRRLWPTIGILVGGIAAAAIALAASGSSGPHFSFGPVSVISSPAPKPALPASDRSSGPPSFHPAPAAVAHAGKLPLAAQVAQLFLVSDDGASATPWGGVVLTSSNSPTDASAVAGSVQNGIAPLVAATQEGGPQTAFKTLPPEGEETIGAAPQPAALARAQAQLAGTKLRALGVNMTLAPLADVDTPGGALTGRLFATDPALVARLSVAAVQGYAAAGEISAVGHFPGSGSASADPDQVSATVGGSLAELEGHDLVPFAAVAPLAPVIEMSNATYGAFDGVTPAALLPQAVQLLRRTYRFAGVVMTDDLDATLNPTGSDPGTVALEALKAGDDLLYITGPPSERAGAYAGVLAAAKRSAAVRTLVRVALLRDLTLKARYGLLR